MCCILFILSCWTKYNELLSLHYWMKMQCLVAFVTLGHKKHYLHTHWGRLRQKWSLWKWKLRAHKFVRSVKSDFCKMLFSLTIFVKKEIKYIFAMPKCIFISIFFGSLKIQWTKHFWTLSSFYTLVCTVYFHVYPRTCSVQIGKHFSLVAQKVIINVLFKVYSF
mgnify:CR=1 FL=1